MATISEAYYHVQSAGAFKQMVPSAIDRYVRRSYLYIYNSSINTATVYITKRQISVTAATGSMIELAPGDSYFETENSHGLMYQGSYWFYGSASESIDIVEGYYAK